LILADSSVWVDHLRVTDLQLVKQLRLETILIHPFVIGELLLGSLPNRPAHLQLFRDLPQAVIATDQECLDMIEAFQIYSMGIGYVDAHLLASVRLTPGTSLWTRDKRLLAAAEKIGVMCEKPER
jgi:predicted nucleic acid-binding protein